MSGGLNFVYPLSDAIADNICAPYAVEPWPAEDAPRQTHELFFCESNAAAQRLALTTPSSDCLTYESRDDGTYARKLSAFRDGQIKRIYCNRMLTEGFDAPQISSIYIHKETKSDILNYQMVGRALRFLPGKVARIYCVNSPCEQRVQDALRRAD